MNALTLSASRRRNQVVILTGLSLSAKYSTPLRARFSRALSMAWQSAKCKCTVKKSVPAVADVNIYSDICHVYHLNQAIESPSAKAVSLFCGHGLCHIYSSVPCGALMRPQPDSGGRQRGAELFSCPPILNDSNHSIHFNCLPK